MDFSSLDYVFLLRRGVGALFPLTDISTTCLVPHIPNSPLWDYWRSKVSLNNSHSMLFTALQNPSPTNTNRCKVTAQYLLKWTWPPFTAFRFLSLYFNCFINTTVFPLPLFSRISRELPKVIPHLNWQKTIKHTLTKHFPRQLQRQNPLFSEFF